MKKTKRMTPSITLAAFLAATGVTSLNAQEQKTKTKELFDWKHVDELSSPWGKEDPLAISAASWWGRHYTEGLGLALFDEGVVAMPKPVVAGDSTDVGFDGEGFKALKPGETIINYPLSDAIPIRRCEVDGTCTDLDGHNNWPLVFLRVQDDLTSKPRDAQPGTVLWSSDSDTGTSTMVNAALLADFYFAGYDNKSLGRYSSRGQFHLLLGAEMEKFDGGSVQAEVDIRRYLAVAEFSPGGLLGIKTTASNQLRQTMTLGFLHENDTIRDVQRNSVQLRVMPSFNLPGDWLDMFVGERSFFEKPFQFWKPKDLLAVLTQNRKVDKMAQVNSPGKTQGDKADAALAAADPSKMDEVSRAAYAELQRRRVITTSSSTKFDHFFYLRPNAGLEYGDVSASSLLKDRTLPDMNLVYTLETGVSFYKERYNLGYRLSGFTGITKGSTHISHEFFLQASPGGWPGRIFATYKKGDVAPAFVDIDVVQVGVGLKF